MTEREMLDRAQALAAKTSLPVWIGLGDIWGIALSASPILPPVAEELLESAHTEYGGTWPEDVFLLSHTHRSGTARYLLLRGGSPAMARWLSDHNGMSS